MTSKFEIGATYTARSICDSGTVFSWTVVSRTPKFITLQEDGTRDPKRVGVKVDNEGEWASPDGTYSMAPTIRAVSKADPVEVDEDREAAIEEARQSYADRQEARRERLEDRADKADAESTSRLAAAKQTADMIPFGQPIQHPSHHSHRGDVNRRERMWNNFGKAYELSDKADHLRGRAASVGTGGIASDDPDAVDLLRAKLEGEEKLHEFNKAARKTFKKVTGGPTAYVSDVEGDKLEELKAALAEIDGMTDERMAKLLTPCMNFNPTYGVPQYELTNRSANMNRMRKRIAELETHDVTDTSLEFEGEGWRIHLDDGRVCAEFESKETLTMEQRKSILSGWNWSRMNQRFQRKDTPNGRRSAAHVAGRLAKEIGQ